VFLQSNLLRSKKVSKDEHKNAFFVNFFKSAPSILFLINKKNSGRADLEKNCLYERFFMKRCGEWVATSSGQAPAETFSPPKLYAKAGSGRTDWRIFLSTTKRVLLYVFSSIKIYKYFEYADREIACNNLVAYL
jgi:hypothetical protein